MKKLITIFFMLIFLITIKIFANENENLKKRSKFGIGLKTSAGIGLASKSSTDGRIEADYCIYGGVFSDFGIFTKHRFGFSIQMEILGYRTAGTLDKVIAIVKKKRIFETNQSVLVGAIVPIYLKPKFKMGPGDCYLLLGPTHFIGTRTDSDDNNTITIFDVIFGIGLGVGYEFYLETGRLSLGLLYTSQIESYIKPMKMDLRTFTFEIGYSFNM